MHTATKNEPITTQSQVLSAPPGRHNVGRGLYLIVSADSRNRRWALRYVKSATRRPTELGLGTAELVTLKEALDLAFDHRRSIAQGKDPIEEKRNGRRLQITFAEMANAYLAIKRQDWRSEGHFSAVRTLLNTYASPLATKYVHDITPDDVEATLRPIWSRSRTQGKRTQAAIFQVFELAIDKGRRTDRNPADWRIMKRRFPKVGKTRNFTAMEYTDVPAFVERLHRAQGNAAVSPSAIEFLVLTGCREAEVAGMKWSEVDFTNRLWTIPAERTKTEQEHRVPLSDRAVELLHQRAGCPAFCEYVWPGRRKNTHIGPGALYLYLAKYMKVPVTIHGFRSTFKDWCGEETHFADITSELALGHLAGDKTKRAYKRKTELEKRRVLMQAWADFCLNGKV
jgi:integrase